MSFFSRLGNVREKKMEKRLMQYARERTLPLSDLSGDYTFSAQLIPDSSLSLSLSVCLSVGAFIPSYIFTSLLAPPIISLESLLS